MRSPSFFIASAVETGHVFHFPAARISNALMLQHALRSARRGVVTFFAYCGVRTIVSCYLHPRRGKFFIFPPKFLQLFLPKQKKKLRRYVSLAVISCIPNILLTYICIFSKFATFSRIL